MPFAERKEAYAADVTYGTNSEFGFDYLRDNMAVSLPELVQRSHRYAIVDEVDSILIDEARTPLIISGQPETAASTYYDFARIVKTLESRPAKILAKGEDQFAEGGDFVYDEKFKTVSPSEDGDREGRARAQDRQPLRPAERPARQPPDPVAEGAVALQARHRLRDPGRRGQDRRREHRPDHGRPPLERGPAPGDRGEGGPARSRRSTSRSRRSRSRTTSASTRSSPA